MIEMNASEQAVINGFLMHYLMHGMRKTYGNLLNLKEAWRREGDLNPR